MADAAPIDSGEPDGGPPQIIRGDASLCGPWPSAVATLLEQPPPPPGPARLLWIHTVDRLAHSEYPVVRESTVIGPAVLNAQGELCAENVGGLNNPGCIGSDGRTTWEAYLPQTLILAGPVTCPDGRMLWLYGQDGRLFQAFPGEEPELVAYAWQGNYENGERIVVGPAGSFAFSGLTTDNVQGIQCRSRCGGLLWQAAGVIRLISASSAGYYVHHQGCIWLISSTGEVRGRSICPGDSLDVWPLADGELLVREGVLGGSRLAWTDSELSSELLWQSYDWSPSSIQDDLLAGYTGDNLSYSALLSPAFIVRRGEPGCAIPMPDGDRMPNQPMVLADDVVMLTTTVGEWGTHALHVAFYNPDCSLREELILPELVADDLALITSGGLLYLLGDARSEQNLPTLVAIAIQTSYRPATRGWSEPTHARSLGTPFGGAASWDIYLADQDLR